jgi:N-acyl-L-homoserine lactone synthetase
MTQWVDAERSLGIDDECEVLVADTPQLLAECCRLRHQVFCLETGIFKPLNEDRESDEFDAHARHVLLVHRGSGQAIGTTRIIPASRHVDRDRFPMTRAFAPGILRGLPARSTGEISRFAISKQRRGSCGASMMMRLGLMQGIVRLSGELGLTHWCAIMEPTLVRMFQRNGIEFGELGPPIEYFGWRQPVFAEIAALSHLLKMTRWDVWNYVSGGGSLWSERMVCQTPELEFA